MRAGYFVFAVLWICGCAGMPRQEQASEQPQEPAATDWKDRLETVGIGAPNPILPSATQRKATARNAALIKARYELLSAVRGLVLKSGITLGAAVDLDPALEDRIKEAVAGAEIKTEFTPDDGCVVRLYLSKRKLAEGLGVRFK